MVGAKRSALHGDGYASLELRGFPAENPFNDLNQFAFGKRFDPDADDRRLRCSGARKDRVKVGISGECDPVLFSAPIEDDFIGRRCQADVASVDGIEALLAQSLSNSRGEILVQQNSHRSGTGSSMWSSRLAAP